jgi:hypothetical protein
VGEALSAGHDCVSFMLLVGGMTCGRIRFSGGVRAISTVISLRTIVSSPEASECCTVDELTYLS